MRFDSIADSLFRRGFAIKVVCGKDYSHSRIPARLAMRKSCPAPRGGSRHRGDPARPPDLLHRAWADPLLPVPQSGTDRERDRRCRRPPYPASRQLALRSDPWRVPPLRQSGSAALVLLEHPALVCDPRRRGDIDARGEGARADELTFLRSLRLVRQPGHESGGICRIDSPRRSLGLHQPIRSTVSWLLLLARLQWRGTDPDPHGWRHHPRTEIPRFGLPRRSATDDPTLARSQPVHRRPGGSTEEPSSAVRSRDGCRAAAPDLTIGFIQKVFRSRRIANASHASSVVVGDPPFSLGKKGGQTSPRFTHAHLTGCNIESRAMIKSLRKPRRHVRAARAPPHSEFAQPAPSSRLPKEVDRCLGITKPPVKQAFSLQPL